MMQLAALLIFFSVTHGFACVQAPVSGMDLRSGVETKIDPSANAKGTVFAFVSMKCPCSRSHEARLRELSKEFPEMQFVAVHSNPDEDETAARVYFKEAGFEFPVLRDKQTKIADAFGALKTPHVFIVGSKGECLFNGGIDDSKDASNAKKQFLREALLDLRGGNAPQVKQARTLGCVIQRS